MGLPRRCVSWESNFMTATTLRTRTLTHTAHAPFPAHALTTSLAQRSAAVCTATPRTQSNTLSSRRMLSQQSLSLNAPLCTATTLRTRTLTHSTRSFPGACSHNWSLKRATHLKGQRSAAAGSSRRSRAPFPRRVGGEARGGAGEELDGGGTRIVDHQFWTPVSGSNLGFSLPV